MDRSTRHRATIYSRNQRGELVELRTRQAATPELAVEIAITAARRQRLGAVAYTVEIDADGWEVGTPEVLGRWGAVPEGQSPPA